MKNKVHYFARIVIIICHKLQNKGWLKVNFTSGEYHNKRKSSREWLREKIVAHLHYRCLPTKLMAHMKEYVRLPVVSVKVHLFGNTMSLKIATDVVIFRQCLLSLFFFISTLNKQRHVQRESRSTMVDRSRTWTNNARWSIVYV